MNPNIKVNNLIIIYLLISKTLAEKAAWNFIDERKKNNQPCFELSVLNPGLVFGPILVENLCFSVEPIKRLMLNELPLLPDISMAICDVRDVARAHMNALKDPHASSKRLLIVSKTVKFQNVAKVLREEFKNKGYSISNTVAPNFLLKFFGLFIPELSIILPILGKRPSFESDQFKFLLKKDPIDFKKTIIDTANSLIEKGFIPKKF